MLLQSDKRGGVIWEKVRKNTEQKINRESLKMKRKKSFSMVGILIAKGTMMLAVVGCSIPASSNSINGISYAGTYSGEGGKLFRCWTLGIYSQCLRK